MRYQFPGFDPSLESFCDIDVTVLPDGTAFVICSEDPENPGTSVTNAAEAIATQLCQQQPTIDPTKLVWIERYPPRGPYQLTPESFDLVTFAIADRAGHFVANPKWQPLSEQQVQALRTATLAHGIPTA